jgi:hypothetical protein
MLMAELMPFLRTLFFLLYYIKYWVISRMRMPQRFRDSNLNTLLCWLLNPSKTWGQCSLCCRALAGPDGLTTGVLGTSKLGIHLPPCVEDISANSCKLSHVPQKVLLYSESLVSYWVWVWLHLVWGLLCWCNQVKIKLYWIRLILL